MQEFLDKFKGCQDMPLVAKILFFNIFFQPMQFSKTNWKSWQLKLKPQDVLGVITVDPRMVEKIQGLKGSLEEQGEKLSELHGTGIIDGFGQELLVWFETAPCRLGPACFKFQPLPF